MCASECPRSMSESGCWNPPCRLVPQGVPGGSWGSGGFPGSLGDSGPHQCGRAPVLDGHEGSSLTAPCSQVCPVSDKREQMVALASHSSQAASESDTSSVAHCTPRNHQSGTSPKPVFHVRVHPLLLSLLGDPSLSHGLITVSPRGHKWGVRKTNLGWPHMNFI